MIRPSENINLKLGVYDVLFDVRWVLDGSPGPTVAGYVKDDAFSSIRLYLVFFVIGATVLQQLMQYPREGQSNRF